ncbi:MAG: acetyl-CoA carboxylase biotin carboxylase subunit [Anaerolineae bacterium]|nr:MAG: acetyl-CoA carboxylase biotin carboxylase subunit [Anaerolineae bacterium]
MFKNVLVANRGEIAVRVIRACRELGVRTVALFSEVDRSALHVRRADEAYCIGGAQARHSYLQMDRVLQVAQQAGVDAIHPGYGFLAENPLFARRCQEAGFVFVGPGPETIALLGNKVAARRLMAQAGGSIIAGTDLDLPDEALIQAAGEIGYPVVVKAAFGGGGKGMRVVHRREEMPAALRLARREAEAAFGDPAVYLEKVVQGVRHIEFQILADASGNVIHLGEREGSVQRRHQKVVEEAPSRALDDDLRREMGQVAVRVARLAGYVNAGTVEFLLDKDGKFYFLEMNPRLQVEHPVTEMVTGVDLVKEQLRVASGRKLRYRQEGVRLWGWAMECRILAEDPFRDFAPSVGRVTQVHEPAGPGVRVESGIYPGFDISLYYDSLISKLIAWGETRGEALLRMRRALEEYRIMGVKTNIPYLQQILNSPSFQGGQTDTRFLDRRCPPAAEERSQDLLVVTIAAALLAHRQRQERRRASAVLARNGGRTSNWKQAGRWMGVRR